MKSNYLLFIFLIAIILFRGSLLNLTNNITSSLFITDETLEISLLQKQNAHLTNEISELLDFQNNIRIEYDYILTNAVRNNYGFNRLIINGSNYEIGDEVVNTEGLIGIISKINHRTSEVTLLHNTNIVVSVSGENGKIIGRDDENNLIVGEVSNYNNIRLNDHIYSAQGSFIGRVIRIRYDIIDHYLTVEGVDNTKLNFLGVIRR